MVQQGESKPPAKCIIASSESTLSPPKEFLVLLLPETDRGERLGDRKMQTMDPRICVTLVSILLLGK